MSTEKHIPDTMAAHAMLHRSAQAFLVWQAALRNRSWKCETATAARVQTERPKRDLALWGELCRSRNTANRPEQVSWNSWFRATDSPPTHTHTTACVTDSFKVELTSCLLLTPERLECHPPDLKKHQ